MEFVETITGRLSLDIPLTSEVMLISSSEATTIVLSAVRDLNKRLLENLNFSLSF
jgi:hypothetical protein